MISRPQKLGAPICPFTEDEFWAAHDEWGFNCGPASLATIAGLKPAQVRGLLPSFEQKRYTNPTMMLEALKALGIGVQHAGDSQKLTQYGICRIQWEGPWTQPGAPAKWAYTKTHWIGAMVIRGYPWVYDVNADWQEMEAWEKITVPALTSAIERATGKWRPTNRWELVFR
jgi:hypothetical protein